MGCGGCHKARMAMAAKMQEQAKIREQNLANLPPEQRLTVIPHIPAPPTKTPKQIRIEARNLRIARRIARRIAAQKAADDGAKPSY